MPRPVESAGRNACRASRGGDVPGRTRADGAAERPRPRTRAEIDRELQRERRLLKKQQQRGGREWWAGHRRVGYLDGLDKKLEQGQLVLLGVAQPAEFSIDRADKRVRVQHILSLLAPDYRQLLVERYMMGETLEDMAERRRVRYQSLQDKLETAEQEFVRVFAEHWGDPLELS